MKIRTGFVANSSSSSFVCDVYGCGGIWECYDEAGMFECENNHTFCQSDVSEELCEKLKEYEEGDIPASECPLCRLDIISTSDLESYKNFVIGKSDKTLVKEIQKTFGYGENSRRNFDTVVVNGELK